MKIPYSSRSKFLAPIEEVLATKHSHLLSGVEVVMEEGGYDATITVTINADDKAGFEAQWTGTDATRFPVRIKAAATALWQSGLSGTFVITHRGGHLMMRREGQREEAGWSREELKAAVEAYVEMLRKHLRGEKVVKARCYQKLSKRFDRSPSAFEFRLQNISAVYAQMGRQWLPGLKPAAHVGSQVATTLQELIAEVEEETGVLHASLPKPLGVRNPRLSVVMVKQYSRSAAVQEWVLSQARGQCEYCQQVAPFVQENGAPYLEVHHVRPLAEYGTDTPENTVALCPNCHRELHYGARAGEMRQALYAKVARLIKE